MKKNIFNNMNYSTYKKLDNISFCSTLYGVINPFVLSAINNYPEFEILLLSFVSASQIYYFSTNTFDCEKYTKDILELKELYNKVIGETSTLINEFNLKHPLEVYSFYNYLLYKGYLSYDKMFFYGKSYIDDIKSLLGINIINGTGVCRHISSMLNDIYNNMNFNACTSSVYVNSNLLMHESLQELYFTYEEQLKMSTDKEDREMLKNILTDTKKLLREYKPKFEPHLKANGNHMINLVSNNDFGYILDPTNKVIYKKSDSISENILKNPVLSPLSGKVKLTHISDNSKQKKSILLLPDSCEEDDELIINNTTMLCRNNLDILNKFRNENSDLYNEINDKLVKIKKK